MHESPGLSSLLSTTPNTVLVLLDVAGRVYGLPVPVVQDVLKVRRTGRSGWSICRPSSSAGDGSAPVDIGGRHMPLVDLRERLGLPAAPSTRTRTLVVIQTGERWLGLLVDTVVEIVEVPRSSIEAVPSTANRHRAVYLEIRLGDRTIGLLDAEQLLPAALEPVAGGR